MGFMAMVRRRFRRQPSAEYRRALALRQREFAEAYSSRNDPSDDDAVTGFLVGLTLGSISDTSSTDTFSGGGGESGGGGASGDY
jgi:uncharacterized membrane protein YgcG